MPTTNLSHSSGVLSKFTQRYAHNKLNHIPNEFIESLWWNWTKLRVFFEFIEKNPVGILLSLFWMISERTLNEWLRVCCGHILIKIVKEPLGFFQPKPSGHVLIKILKEPLGFFQTKPSGFVAEFFLKMPSIKPVGLSQVYCLKNQKKLSIYLVGK